MEDESIDGLSLEDIKQLYASEQPSAPRAPDGTDMLADGARETAESEEDLPSGSPDEDDQHGEESDSDNARVTPDQIIEAALFVGNPDNRPLSAQELAAIMRGVEEAEVVESIQRLNELYARQGHAMRITEGPLGYRMELASDLHPIKERFYGKIRPIVLSPAAVDCLSLVAYQPGITREKIDDQRGQASGSILAQLVRRQLLEIRRSKDDNGNNVTQYYPTERFLQLVGIGSLDDLPTVEEYDPSMPLYTE